jgi:putative membrane protein insertion efficiency factor
MSEVPISMLKFYKKWVSPFLERVFGGACRFTPTCSEYMEEALKKHGVSKGFWMGAKRLGKCHPWGGSGYDPVPYKT